MDWIGINRYLRENGFPSIPFVEEDFAGNIAPSPLDRIFTLDSFAAVVVRNHITQYFCQSHSPVRSPRALGSRPGIRRFLGER